MKNAYIILGLVLFAVVLLLILLKLISNAKQKIAAVKLKQAEELEKNPPEAGAGGPKSLLLPPRPIFVISDTLEKLIWILFFIFLGVFSLIIAGIIAAVFNDTEIGLMVGVGNFLVAILITAMLGWMYVPENYEWQLELFGAFCKTLYSGLYVRFPYFGFFQIREETKTFMGDLSIALQMRKEKTRFGLGEVEFIDASSPVDADVYFRVVDSRKAVYSADDILNKLAKLLDSALRNYLGGFTIDEAIKLKVHFELAHVLNGAYPMKEDEKYTFPPIKLESVGLWSMILEYWGIQLLFISVSDLDLPDNIRAIRDQKLAAEKELEISEIKRKTTVINADAEMQALAKRGEGLATQLDLLTSKGASPGQAVELLLGKDKWAGITRPTDRAVIIDNGQPGGGASTGAGIAAVLNSVTTGQKGKKDDDQDKDKKS